MTDIAAPTPGYPSTLSLLRAPFVFTQAEVIGASGFAKEAKRWGVAVTHRELESLAGSQLLVPFFRVHDDPDPSLAIRASDGDHGRAAHYADDGLLRDPATEEYRAPCFGSDNEPTVGWNEFLYSQWQLLDLKQALAFLDSPLEPDAEILAYAQRMRHERMALAVLSTRFLPGILNRMRIPSGSSPEQVWDARDGISAADLLTIAAYPGGALRGPAEFLLSSARANDPLKEYWSLFRHADHRAWFKVAGPALASNWKRIAAEVLLQAHEELAEAGQVAPLVADHQGRVRSALADRIGDTPEGLSLEGALSDLGLSTTARVILAVEGRTETIHLPRLLDALGVTRHTRVISINGSGNIPSQLASFVSPVISHHPGYHPRLESGPTALMVVMDPENKYKTADMREKVAQDLRALIRDGVGVQGGELTAAELDTLVKVQTWPDASYEYANFTDSELFDGFVAIAPEHLTEEQTDRLREAITKYRRDGADLKHVFRAMQWRVRKLHLADALTRVLLDDLDQSEEPRPVVQVALEAAQLVERLSRGGYRLELAAGESAEIPGPADSPL